MAPIEPQRLDFLHTAAESLTSLSPSTAAHLLSVHTQILHEQSKPLNVRQQAHHCGACGSLRKPKWTRGTQIKPRKNKGRSSSRAASASGATIYKCLRCHRRTVQPRKRASAPKQSPTVSGSASPATARQALSSETVSAQVVPPGDVPRPSKTAENASSKKRAKARKQGGLQALLASKQRSQPSSSLDLLDFLQQ